MDDHISYIVTYLKTCYEIEKRDMLLSENINQLKNARNHNYPHIETYIKRDFVPDESLRHHVNDKSKILNYGFSVMGATYLFVMIIYTSANKFGILSIVLGIIAGGIGWALGMLVGLAVSLIYDLCKKKAIKKDLKQQRSAFERKERLREQQITADNQRETARVSNENKIYNDEIKNLISIRMQTRKILSRLYAVNILYPKYRNLVAISVFIQYFESGRVKQFGGADGAYNLFENEYRQNTIINSVNSINDQLDKISKKISMVHNAVCDIKQDSRQFYNQFETSINTAVSAVNHANQQLLYTNAMQTITAYNTSLIKDNMRYLKNVAVQEQRFDHIF